MPYRAPTSTPPPLISTTASKANLDLKDDNKAIYAEFNKTFTTTYNLQHELSKSSNAEVTDKGFKTTLFDFVNNIVSWTFIFSLIAQNCHLLGRAVRNLQEAALCSRQGFKHLAKVITAIKSHLNNLNLLESPADDNKGSEFQADTSIKVKHWKFPSKTVEPDAKSPAPAPIMYIQTKPE